jgi:hypothetical protein
MTPSEFTSKKWTLYSALVIVTLLLYGSVSDYFNFLILKKREKRKKILLHFTEKKTKKNGDSHYDILFWSPEK